MFKRKHTRIKHYIEVIHGENQVHSLYKRGELPIKENAILEKSIQFFNDPDPCYIHRGAVNMRINEEIMQKIQQYNANERILFNQENTLFKQIDLEDIHTITWYEYC